MTCNTRMLLLLPLPTRCAVLASAPDAPLPTPAHHPQPPLSPSFSPRRALDASNSLKGLNNAAGVPGWAFKGQRIVEATLMVLQQYFGLGTLPATQMLLAGCDAGAQGVMYNLDYLNTMLPISGSGVTGVQVKGLLDSATFIDIDPLNPDGVDSLVNQTITAWALYNATGRLGYACMKGYNTLYPDKFPPNELWKCMFGQYRLPYLRTDYIVSQSQFDSWQLDFDAARHRATTAAPPLPHRHCRATALHCTAPLLLHHCSCAAAPAADCSSAPRSVPGPPQGAKPPFENETLSAYAESFQMATRAALLPLPTSEQPNSGVFSSSCYHHCTLNSDSFWGIYVGDLNLKARFGGRKRIPVRCADRRLRSMFGIAQKLSFFP